LASVAGAGRTRPGRLQVLAAPDLPGAGAGRPAWPATGAGRRRPGRGGCPAGTATRASRALPDRPPSPAAAQVVSRRTTRFAAIWTVPRGGPRPGS